MNDRLFMFVASQTGRWRIVRIDSVKGEPLPSAGRLDILSESMFQELGQANWFLRGIRSNERYVVREEKDLLAAKQPPLDRPETVCAALIPIRKNAAWWNLAQDERRKIFEEQSHHIKVGFKYLPAVARRLYHCRDLGENEPFDFLTWFEYASCDEAVFDKLVAELRTSPEWTYVDREIDIRLVRDPD